MLAAVLVPGVAEAAKATLSWDPPAAGEMVTGWKVYYDRDMAGAPYEGTEADQGPSPIDLPIASIADPMAPSFEVTGLESCVTYYFALTAYNDAGESDFSNEASKKVAAAPRNLTAVSQVPGEVLLTWEGPPPDDPGIIPGYQVFYDLDGPGEPYSAPGSPFTNPTTEANLTGLTTNATYWFVVDSVCDNFASSRSEEVSVQVIAELPDGPDPDPVDPTPIEPTPDPGDDGDDEPAATTTDAGCGCASAPHSANGSWLLVVALLAGRRRRGARGAQR